MDDVFLRGITVWRQHALDELAHQPICGYRRQASAYSEPTALAALALQSHGRIQAASKAALWLAGCQRNDGSLGLSASEHQPSWPTGLAVLAWRSLGADWSDNVERALEWIIRVQGDTFENSENLVGHDTQIPGWSWVRGTHSWVEPTALNIAALKACDYSDHERSVDGIRMLRDRLLSAGGCNYGNTVVLGQSLKPHVMPTGLTLLALANEPDLDGRIGTAVDYLRESISHRVTTASLSYALLGLAAQGIVSQEAHSALATAVQRTNQHHGSPPHLSLALLAAQGKDSLLVRMVRQEMIA
jgi:hypothetical protein